MTIHKTEFKIVVLWDDEDGQNPSEMPIGDVIHEMNEGCMVGSIDTVSVQKIKPENVPAELNAVGSDSSFFGNMEEEH